MSPRELLDRLNEKPFKPFRVQLTDGTSIKVADHPGHVIVGPTSAVLPLRTRRDNFGYTLVTQPRTIF